MCKTTVMHDRCDNWQCWVYCAKWVKKYAMWVRKKVKLKKLKLEICGWNLNYSLFRKWYNILSYDDFVKLRPQLLLSNSKYNIENKS